jgi:hypothetical protein
LLALILIASPAGGKPVVGELDHILRHRLGNVVAGDRQTAAKMQIDRIPVAA